MDDRERLVELIEKARAAMKKEELSCDLARNFFFAEYLLNNGVTVQRHGRQFAYRCPECNSSVIDFSKREKPRLIPCPRCGAKMDLEDSNDKI